MPYLMEYKEKLVSPEEAIKLIPSCGNLSMGMAISEPPALLKALEKRIKAPSPDSIQELRVYYMHSERASRETIFKYEYMDVIKPYSFFMGPTERSLVAQGRKEGKKTVSYIPCNFNEMPHFLNKLSIDAFIVTVSPMDKSGLFSCGTNCDYTISTARMAKKLIVEVNPHMPRVFGDSCLHLSEIDAIIEYVCPLMEITEKPITVVDRKISQYVTQMIPDRATLQIGIGSVPNAVCESLIHHKGLGIHSELLGPGLVRLIQSGVVTNKYKQINQYKNVYSFAQGDKNMYEFLNNNASMEIYPIHYVNNPLVIGRNDNMVSVNSFLEIDLSGQVNAEAIGGQQYSAPGGQLDFVRGAQLSRNGKSILASHSTANKGKISRIVPVLGGPTTDPRTEVHYVVTEWGIEDLRGKSVSERAVALIRLAHPLFRAELYQQAKKMDYV